MGGLAKYSSSLFETCIPPDGAIIVLLILNYLVTFPPYPPALLRRGTRQWKTYRRRSTCLEGVLVFARLLPVSGYFWCCDHYSEDGLRVIEQKDGPSVYATIKSAKRFLCPNLPFTGCRCRIRFSCRTRRVKCLRHLVARPGFASSVPPTLLPAVSFVPAVRQTIISAWDAKHPSPQPDSANHRNGGLSCASPACW